MMKTTAVIASLAVLAACGPSVPDSGAQGPGFGTYQDFNTYRADRDAELNGASTPPTQGGTPNTTVATSGAAGAPPSTTGAGADTPPADPNNPGISDEQDFDAVANRQTIESDAERLRERRENYQVIQPTAVPTRNGSGSGPNIVAYAVSTSNPVGVKQYRRSLVGGAARAERNCAKYSTADLAQEAFLRSGGPERDKLGVDPDGDGFACSWDPAPFRLVASR